MFTIEPEDLEGCHDLGDGHWLKFACWAPDRGLNPQYAHLPDVEKYAAIVYHRRPDGQMCMGVITLDGPVSRELEPDRSRWQVASWDPLTVTPSLLCLAKDEAGRECGDHGFITNGRWVRV